MPYSCTGTLVKRGGDGTNEWHGIDPTDGGQSVVRRVRRRQGDGDGDGAARRRRRRGGARGGARPVEQTTAGEWDLKDPYYRQCVHPQPGQGGPLAHPTTRFTLHTSHFTLHTCNRRRRFTSIVYRVLYGKSVTNKRTYERMRGWWFDDRLRGYTREQNAMWHGEPPREGTEREWSYYMQGQWREQQQW